MKTINQSIGEIKTRGDFQALRKRAEPESLPGSESLPSSSPIWDAWENLKAAYPGNTANWEAAPPAIWIASLGDLTGEQLLNGLRNLDRHLDARGNISDFPPNAPQFRDLCLTNYKWESAAQRQDFTGHAQLEDLTAKERRQATGLAEIQKLRASTGI